MSLTLAVDIGGTHIRAAVYEADSTKPLAQQRTRSQANKPGVYDRLVKAIIKAYNREHEKETEELANRQTPIIIKKDQPS